MNGAAAALSLAGLSKEFGGLRAVDGVSLEVAPGERRAIIGPNGAGKTTLFSLISGETKPTAGRIHLFGRDVTRLPPHRRAALGLARTYQITNLFPRLTVLENSLLAVQALTAAKLHPPWKPWGLGQRRTKLSASFLTASSASLRSRWRWLECRKSFCSMSPPPDYRRPSPT